MACHIYMASHCGQKSVFSNITNSFSNIRNSFSNITNSFSNIRNSFLAHLSRRLKWAIVIAHRPSSSVVRKLSHFQLLLWNRWTEFNETWQEARSQHPLPSLCFSGRSEKQDGRPGLWLAETFSTSPPKPLNRILRNLTGSKISTPHTKFVFFGPIGTTRWPP